MTTDMTASDRHDAGYRHRWDTRRRVASLVVAAGAGVLLLGAGTVGALPRFDARSGLVRPAASRPTHAVATAGARAGAIALEEGVEIEALNTEASAGVNNKVATADTSRLARAVAVDAAGWAALQVPAALRPDLRAVVIDDKALASAFAADARSTSLASLQHALNDTMGSAWSSPISAFNTAQNLLLKRLGQPTNDSWWGAQDAGTPIYTDAFASSRSGWLLGSNVRYGKGFLAVTASPQRGAMSSPRTSQHFDSSHITVQVEARPSSAAKVFYGLACPGLPRRQHPYAIVGTDGSWYMGLTSYGAGGRAYTFYSSSKPAPALHQGTAPNVLRLDCQEYAPSFSSVRLYVNGAFIAEQAFPVGIPRSINPGVQVVNEASAPVTVDYSDWRVSALPAAPRPPLPIPS